MVVVISNYNQELALHKAIKLSTKHNVASIKYKLDLILNLILFISISNLYFYLYFCLLMSQLGPYF
jgi:hypothetical protein